MKSSTFTVMAPNPMLNANGEPFYVNCARCSKNKSSTDVSCVKEIPWKYFCQHCIVCVMMDAESEGKIVVDNHIQVV